MKVRKKDGSSQEFNFEKIVRSIEAASDDVGEPMTLSDLNNISKEVEKKLKALYKDEVSYVEIRDTIINELESSGFSDVAKSYSDF